MRGGGSKEAKRPKVRGGTIEFTCNSPLPSFPCSREQELRLISRAMLPAAVLQLSRRVCDRMWWFPDSVSLGARAARWLCMAGHQCRSHSYTSVYTAVHQNTSAMPHRYNPPFHQNTSAKYHNPPFHQYTSAPTVIHLLQVEVHWWTLPSSTIFH